MFAQLPEPGADPILGSAKFFRADPSPDKVDMGIGVYKDHQGRAPVLPSVKAAERILLENQASKEYLSPAGNPAYNEAIRALLFNDGTGTLERAVTIQAPGGTGALRLAADFLRAHRPGATVFIPAPTWPNHRNIFATAGFAVKEYPYYDTASGQLKLTQMLETIALAKAGDVIILHACCHNPTGEDPGPQAWRDIARLVAEKGLLPIIDIAYLGFGGGLDDDLAGLRVMVSEVPELLVASSCSKNFALYRERLGALSVVGADQAAAERAAGHVLIAARSNYSMPPDHGASVVAEILGDAGLRAQWTGELATMRDRLRAVRSVFAQTIGAASGQDFAHVARQKGLFCLIALQPDMVRTLREEHHIFVSASGRLNLAGMKTDDVERVADAIGRVLRTGA